MQSRRNRSTASVGRRSLLEWLGGASVLALTSPLIEACKLEAVGSSLGTVPEAGAGGQAGSAGSGGGAGSDAGADSATEAGAHDGSILDAQGCKYEPGTLTRADLINWAENTIDPQDLASILAGWTFSITGLVNKPMQAGFCELRDLGLVHQVTDFHCVEGWSVYDVPWDGIPLAALLDMVGVLPTAKYLKIHCFGGEYFEELAIDVAREPKSILALGVDGATLPVAHGFPCRVVVPRLLGYKNPKYVDKIELVDTQPSAYWPQYGYSMTGEVPADRLRPGKY